MTSVRDSEKAHATVSTRHGLLVVVVAAVALALLASCGGGGSDSSSDTVDPDLAKAGAPFILCKAQDADSGSSGGGEVQRLVDNLEREASLADAPGYEDFRALCDNTGVTSFEAPTDYAAIEPTASGPPQTSIRAATDFSVPIEEAPIINFFAAPVGGSQFPTEPPLRQIIQQSAHGSLSSGTRDPREGTTITEDCQALPFRDFTAGGYSGKARFYVNCGHDHRAWVLLAATPDNGDPYFIQVVAQTLDTADANALGRALDTMTVDSQALARVTGEPGGQGGTGDDTTTTTAP